MYSLTYNKIRSVLFFASFFFFIFFSGSVFGNEKEPESNRYVFYENPLTIHFNIKPFNTIESVTGELFGLKSSDGTYRTIFMDWSREDGHCNVFFNVNHKVKRQVFHHVDLNAQTTIAIVVDFKNDQIALAINNDTVIVKNMHLLPDEGYRYSILPILSVSPDEDTNPIFTISNLSISAKSGRPSTERWKFFLIIFVNILIIISLYIHHRFRKHQKNTVQDDILNANPFGRFDMPLSKAIYLFGGLKIYDRQGEDISQQLSPILKEVLSLLIIHSPGIGISSAKLTELLWSDMPSKNARNNRGVYFNKLRKILNAVGDIEIENHDNCWKINCGNVFVDYFYYKKKMDLPEEFSKEQIGGIIAIAHNGNILPEMDYLWLDEVKSKIANEIMDRLLAYGESEAVNNNPVIYFALSEVISKLDSFNEDALIFRCKAYVLLGRHQSAKNCYDKFCIEYKSVYNEDFPTPFTEIVK